jgi:hypothetical protein
MSRLFMLPSFVACTLLASCASSTMDSIPTGEKMQIFKEQAQRDYQPDFASIGELRMKNLLSEAEYQKQLADLNDKVVQRAHTLAWNQHNLAEMERKAQGVPTPDAPVANMAPSAMQGGAGGGSMYRPSQQQFNMAQGVGGSNQLSPSQFQTRMSSEAGAMSLQNFPGSIYDDPTFNQ